MPGEPVAVSVMVPVLSLFPSGATPSLQLSGPTNRTGNLTVVVSFGRPLHTIVLDLSISTSPVSSTILRLIGVGSENSFGLHLAPGASTATVVTAMFFVSVDPFAPGVPTFLSET